MRWLELKIPPLALLLLTMALMFGSARLFPSDTLLSLRWPFLYAGVVFGGIVALLGVRAFRRAQTTVLPYCPEQSSTLVTGGIYRYTRNPMYLGLVIFLLGFAGFLGTIAGLLWIVVFTVYLTQFQIKPEERVLAKKFAGEFSDYQRRVRRWI